MEIAPGVDTQFRIIASVYRGLVDIIREAGVASQDIAAEVGVDVSTLIESQNMLSLEQVTALWALGFRIRGETIGLEVAKRVRLVDYQDVGVYLTATNDVADVLHQLEHYCALFSNVVDVSTRDIDGGMEFSLKYAAEVPMLHERLDFLIVSAPVLVSQYLGSPLGISKAELIRPRPTDTRPWDEAFGVPVTWNAPLTRFVVSADECRRRVLTRNEQLRRELQLLLDRRLRAGQSRDPLDEIRHLVRKQFTDQVPSMDSVAKALNVSPRTLQRRLTDAETTFSDLLAGLRQDMAERYLQMGLAVNEVAERLGYADLSTFNRAFRRWLGQTPAQYRKQHQRQPADRRP